MYARIGLHNAELLILFINVIDGMVPSRGISCIDEICEGMENVLIDLMEQSQGNSPLGRGIYRREDNTNIY